ncbi:MAG: alpha/beta fold hydrolase [Acidobacteriota bacterium]
MIKIRNDVRDARERGILSGAVQALDGTNDVFVLLFGRSESGVELFGWDELTALQANWGFVATPDRTYFVGAFKDLDGDRIRDVGEPAAFSGLKEPIQLDAGAIRSNVDLELRAGAAIPEGFVLDANDPDVGNTTIRFNLGEVVELEDPRFSPETGKRGMWEPFKSATSSGAGVYFLEEFDSGRIPVLFIHGIGGTPRDLRPLIDSVDRERFQPWVYTYPSGIRIGAAAAGLRDVMVDLREKLDFPELFVIAHSMGGLVAFDFVKQLRVRSVHDDMVGLLVTLSAPLGGHAASRWGLRFAPEPIPAWIDLDPDGDFVAGLSTSFTRSLPYALFFGYRRGGNPLMPASHDAVIEVRSQLPLWAQEKAILVRGFDLDHAEILEAPELIGALAEVLEDTADSQ